MTCMGEPSLNFILAHFLLALLCPYVHDPPSRSAGLSCHHFPWATCSSIPLCPLLLPLAPRVGSNLPDPHRVAAVLPMSTSNLSSPTSRPALVLTPAMPLLRRYLAVPCPLQAGGSRRRLLQHLLQPVRIPPGDSRRRQDCTAVGPRVRVRPQQA